MAVGTALSACGSAAGIVFLQLGARHGGGSTKAPKPPTPGPEARAIVFVLAFWRTPWYLFLFPLFYFYFQIAGRAGCRPFTPLPWSAARRLPEPTRWTRRLARLLFSGSGRCPGRGVSGDDGLRDYWGCIPGWVGVGQGQWRRSRYGVGRLGPRESRFLVSPSRAGSDDSVFLKGC